MLKHCLSKLKTSVRAENIMPSQTNNAILPWFLFKQMSRAECIVVVLEPIKCATSLLLSLPILRDKGLFKCYMTDMTDISNHVCGWKTSLQPPRAPFKGPISSCKVLLSSYISNKCCLFSKKVSQFPQKY